MKKTKGLLTALLVAMSMVTLSGCALFNDDDLSFTNIYNPSTSEPEEDTTGIYAQGVKAQENDKTPNTLYFKNIGYAVDGKIINTYKADGGVNYTEYNVNNGEDYSGTRSNNNYDLYVPNSVSKDSKHTVILFIHGGAWISGFKSDVNDYVHEFAKRGFITATIKYTLLKESMDDPTLSIFRDLDEIDACVTSIKKALEDLEFDTTKTELVIGGASSGAHLSMLYAYSRGNNAALPIKFIVDAVGPVNIKPDCWKAFKNASEEVLNAGIDKDAIATQDSADNLGTLRIASRSEEVTYWNEYQTMRIANGMCGLPYTLEQVEATANEEKTAIANPNEASNSMTKANGGEDQLSVTYWLNSAPKIPVICAYAGKDSVVGINQFATLQTAMDTKGYVQGTDYEMFYFKNSNHTEISAKADEATYNAFVDKIENWCNA